MMIGRGFGRFLACASESMQANKERMMVVRFIEICLGIGGFGRGKIEFPKMEIKLPSILGNPQAAVLLQEDNRQHNLRG